MSALSRQSAAAERAERIVRQPNQESPGEKSQGGDHDNRDEKDQGHSSNMKENCDKSKN
jgi:hypothetical protein